MRPFLKTALPVTSAVSSLSCKFERCTVFRFWLNGGHGTDRRTDRHRDIVKVRQWNTDKNSRTYRQQTDRQTTLTGSGTSIYGWIQDFRVAEAAIPAGRLGHVPQHFTLQLNAFLSHLLRKFTSRFEDNDSGDTLPAVVTAAVGTISTRVDGDDSL